MSGGPDSGRFDDPRLAAALRAGDVIALSEVYDTYAPYLFDYCHGLLRDRVEAAGALRNCLIAAREHVGNLREPERLRGWLYALARKECMRRRDNPSRHLGQTAPEVGEDDLSEEQRARRAERRLIAHSALAALDGRQREAIDLTGRHELDAVDLAGIFGIPPAEAMQLLSDARRDLEEATRAVLVAHLHWEDCPSLAALTGAWPLQPERARSLPRHVHGCPVCSAHEVPALPLDRLLAVLPIAAVPADLRLDVLTAATAPDRADNRRAVAALAEPFDEAGRPLPYRPGPARERPVGHRRGRILTAVGGGLAAVALIAGSLTIFDGGEPTGSAAPEPRPTRRSGPLISDEPSASPTAPRTTRRAASASPTPSPSRTRKPPKRRPSGGPTVKAPGPVPTSSTPAPRPAPGSLNVIGCDMGGGHSCTVTVTAVGGPVDWQVAEVSGQLSAGGSGHLRDGQSAAVTVARTGMFCWGGRHGAVRFSPGGTAPVAYC